jgi:sugar (pentulose or hexulose) kinase
VQQAIAIVDVGKTRSKVSLWSEEGTLLQALDRGNLSVERDGLAQLDVSGIAEWLTTALARMAGQAEIKAIVPVAHGAAAVLVDADAAVCALDYEEPPPPDIVAAYDRERDTFNLTLSPRLPGGLNLGVQLFWLEQLFPELWPSRGRVLLWPQYWAHVFSGGMVSEVTSLGCHSDLWRPYDHRHSDLALRRGWVEPLGPLAPAGEPIGRIAGALARATGLPRQCLVYCGLHDSNAALCDAKGMAELAGGPFSVVSTGTWFVCMSAGASRLPTYDPTTDMLANVDVDGEPTPTARFMGGRDYELWMGADIGVSPQIDQLGAARGTRGWRHSEPVLRATRASVELARRTDRALGLIAAEGPILIEGRFAQDPVFGACLAGLRPQQPVYRSDVADGVARGALRLVARAGLRSPPLRLVPAAFDY